MELLVEKKREINVSPVAPSPLPSWKKLIVGRKGLDHIVFNMEDVACFYTSNRLVFLLDKEGVKYILDENLSHLEKELDPSLFFRVNRQYIVHIRFVRKFRTYKRVRIQIELNLPSTVLLYTSQAITAPFRKWIYGH